MYSAVIASPGSEMRNVSCFGPPRCAPGFPLAPHGYILSVGSPSCCIYLQKIAIFAKDKRPSSGELFRLCL